MSYIKVNDLCLGYEGKEVINGISFEVNKGDYFCIVGENGSGKSTLMKALLGLITPISGEVIFGEGLTKKDVGYLPQQTDIQKDFPATSWEIVLSGRQGHLGLRPFYSKNDKAVALENMKKMEALQFKNRCFRELSGGQKQRVLLARALSATEKILLMDEPVSGLDPKVTDEMYNIISELNKSGITIIMISHDIAAAEKYASHILHVKGGSGNVISNN
ncbi:MAG: ABC transporter ATP-binding protein [Eubacterium sp.]|nr:ABC transporter ATP-binding protein [Eubacterium sp.]